MKYTPTCIKCSAKYDSNEPDDYYCESCNKVRLEIAKEVDAKIALRPKKNRVSGWQQFEQLQAQSRLQKGGLRAVDARSLGY